MAKKSHHSITALSSIGIDIGKDVFHVVGFDPSGTIVLRRKIRRLSLVKESDHRLVYNRSGRATRFGRLA